jgi:hypothetical protein
MRNRGSDIDFTLERTDFRFGKYHNRQFDCTFERQHFEVEINGFSVKKGTVVGGSKIEPVFYTPRDFIAQYEFLEVNPVSFRPVRDGSMYRKCLDSMQQKIKELNKNYQ